MNPRIFPFLLSVIIPLVCLSEQKHILALPRLEQLSSGQVMQVIQDSEGFLWYATEGGGLCRDDGRKVTVFRSSADHPKLLGSNDVACVAEASGRYIIIGTFHGAYVLDKHDYSIRHLTEVDDKRVDDIIVSRDGHWWLTANKKIFEYSAAGNLLHTYPGGDKYIFRLHEDKKGRIWCAEWEGGLLRFSGGRLMPAPWPVGAVPTSISDDSEDSDILLVGTFGRGVVKYHPDSGMAELTEPRDSFCMSRVTRDLQGRQLVADGRGNCYVIVEEDQQPWSGGHGITRFAADSIRAARHLSERPTAIAERPNTGRCGADSELWFSTGRDIRRVIGGSEEVILSDTKDVSAMTFSGDGTLWLATIFGTLMSYADGQLTDNRYASNEYGDPVVALETDSLGRLLIVSDGYVRIFDPAHNTLRQQNIEDSGVYRIELQETRPGERWSQPEEEIVVRMPRWVWWMLGTLSAVLIVLLVIVLFLQRQRKRFLAAMKALSPDVLPQESTTGCGQSQKEDEESGSHTSAALLLLMGGQGETPWLREAIEAVEQHIDDDSYNVEQLASDMCMSRMTLYRKIQSATGQKPTQFVRTIRLRRAAALLSQGRMTVTEVSYATGFSSVSYFSRCFRTMFGVPPMLFGKNTTADDLLPSDMPNADSEAV